MPDTFSLALTPAELAWLAGAFGQTRLLLPDAPFQRLLDDELSAELAAGQASLVQRGLIRRVPGSGWQVDRVAAALLQILSSPERAVSLLRLPRAGNESRAIACSSGGMLLALETPPAYQFSFCQDEKALVAQLLRFPDNGSRPPAGKRGQTEWILADVDRLFPHAWREEPGLAGTTEAILLSACATGAAGPFRRGLLLLGRGLQGGEVDGAGRVRLAPLSLPAGRKFVLSFLRD